MNKYISKIIRSCVKTLITLTILIILPAGAAQAETDTQSPFYKVQDEYKNTIVSVLGNEQPDAVSSPTKDSEIEKKKSPANSKKLRYIITIVFLLGFSAIALRSLISKKE